MSEEEEPFLKTGSSTTTNNNITTVTTSSKYKEESTSTHHGRRKATVIILLLSLSAIIPQTLVAIKFNSISLLADSLCMSADAVSYFVSIAVFALLYSGIKMSPRQISILDLSGAFIGFLLLVFSAVYVQSRSLNVLTKAAEKTPKDVEGKWGIIFSLIGGVTDVLCVLALWYFSDPVQSLKNTTGDTQNGGYSYLSVILHLSADIIRLFGLLVCGIISIAKPKTSALTDATVSLIICGVMYLMSLYLLWKLGWLFRKIFCPNKKEKVEMPSSSLSAENI
jgi:Co/Zn/Cd efflux system component